MKKGWSFTIISLSLYEPILLFLWGKIKKVVFWEKVKNISPEKGNIGRRTLFRGSGENSLLRKKKGEERLVRFFIFAERGPRDYTPDLGHVGHWRIADLFSYQKGYGAGFAATYGIWSNPG